MDLVRITWNSFYLYFHLIDSTSDSTFDLTLKLLKIWQHCTHNFSKVPFFANFQDLKFLKVKFRLSEKHTKFEKNLPYDFDKTADLLSKRQNHAWGRFFQIMCASQKVRILKFDISYIGKSSLFNTRFMA